MKQGKKRELRKINRKKTKDCINTKNSDNITSWQALK